MRVLPIIALALCTAGCGASTQRRVVTVTSPHVGSLRLLTSAEILERYGHGNLLDAMFRLRPMLVPRDSESPTVYVDGLQLAGGIIALSGIPTDQVSEVQFLPPATAAIRYGRAHPDGAIVVDLWQRRGTVRVR